MNMEPEGVRIDSGPRSGKLVATAGVGLAVTVLLALLALSQRRVPGARPLYAGRLVSAAWIRPKPGQSPMYVVRMRLARCDGQPVGGPAATVQLRSFGAAVPVGKMWQMRHPGGVAEDYFFAYAVQRPQAIQGVRLLGEVVEYQPVPWWKRLAKQGETEEKWRGPVQGAPVVVPPASSPRTGPSLAEFITARG